MKQPALITEKAHDFSIRPILVVDKKGFIGDDLVKQLKNEGIVVYATEKLPVLEEKDSENIIHIPFLKRIPKIPENDYSYIFIVDDNDILRESILSFLKKAEKDKATLVLMINLLDVSEKMIREIKNYYNNLKIIIYGDVFEIPRNNKETSAVNKLIYDAKRYGKIDLPGDGTKLLYPISKKNLTQGVLEATFGAYKEEKIFYLFPKEGITYLSFAHLLQRNNPWIKIDFIKEKKKREQRFPEEKGNFSIASYNDLQSDIKEIDFREDKLLLKKESIKKDRKIFYSNQKSRKRPFLLTLFFLLLLLLMPAISTLSLTALGAFALQGAKNNFTSGNLKFALRQAEFAQKIFTLTTYSITPLEYELSLLGAKSYEAYFSENIDTGKNISEATVAFLNASNSFSEVFEGKTDRQEEKFISGVNSVKNAISILQKESNKKTPLGEFDKKMGKALNFISSTIDLWPTLAGFDGKKTYLVLLQNNMELRPGGGFIGSYGLLTVDKGKFSNLQINDVYNADGQLKANIEPQFPLRRYLLTKHLFLRDGNFDLDFRNVASQAALIFNLETGKRINGVIGIDLSVLKNILDVTGEVNIPDYNEKVNADNLFYITESHVEKGFFPGSTQKKDFLRSLYEAIVVKAFKEKNVPYLRLLDEAAKSIEEKHLLFGFSNASIQNLFTVSGWSSAVWDERKQSDERVNDFLGLNEANLGGNKVNYFVSRSMSQKVLITKEGLVTEELSISYKNDSDGQWPGGDYKNYLRLILPQGTKITEIAIDGQKQKIIVPITEPLVYEDKKFKAPSGLELEEIQENGKSVYGFFITIPKGKLVKINVSYILAKKINLDNHSLLYDLKLFKQPGIDELPYDLTVKQPEGFKILEKTDEVVTGQGKQVFSKHLVKDENLLITYTKE